MSNTPPNSSSNADSNVPTVAEHDALPIGTRFGEFEILKVVGVGGFGIVYLAQDHSLERQVALKEYMPAALAARGNGSLITVRSAAFAETYAIGLRSFVNEARLLARFDHPSLVKVYRFWEDNGTAYMVMPFLRGMTLRDARRSMARAPDEAWIRSVIDPLLGALEALHREGVYHRDIAPDNVLLPPEGAPILLDFGAARHVISDRTQSLTAILKPSYAPIEQYAEMTAMRQGPWTDIYALGAVMHFLLFGTPPPPATARAVQPDAEPIEQRSVPGVSQRMLAAVGWMLGVRPADRPQNIAMVRDALNGAIQVPTVAVAPLSAAQPPRPTPGAGAASATPAFPPTQMVSRPDVVDETTQLAPATVPPYTVPPRTVPPVTPPYAPNPQVGAASAGAGSEETVVVSRPKAAVSPLSAKTGAREPVQPAARSGSKKGLAIAGGVVAVAVAGVVLWQFVGLLQGGAASPSGAGAASAPIAAASATPVPPIEKPVATAAPSPASATTNPSTATPTSEPSVAAAAPIAASTPSPAADPTPRIPLPTTATQGTAAQNTTTAATGGRTTTPTATPSIGGTGDANVGRSAGTNPATSPATSSTRTAATDVHAVPPYLGASSAALTANPPAGAASRGRPAGRPVPPRDGAEPGVPTYAATPSTSGIDDAARARAAQQVGADTSPANTGPRTATEFCGKRVFIALAICMDRECERPLFRNQPDCKRVLEVKRQREGQ